MLAAPTQAGEASWFRGVNQQGAQGVWLTDAAVAPVPGDFVFVLRESFYALHDVIAPGDSASALTTAAHVSWTPVDGLQLGVGGAILNGSYTRLADYSIRSLGNPVVRFKYGHGLWGGLAAGIAGQLALPTFQVASNARQLAYVAGVKALLSYTFSPRVELHLNAGFVGDRSMAPFANGVSPAQRFMLGLNDTSHWDYAVGAVGRIVGIYLDPFVELSGQLGGASALVPFTARVSPGFKLDPASGAPLEVALGAHLRLTGEPSDTAGYAGLPQWEVFVQVALHVLSTRGSERAWDRRPCTLDAECGAQQVCAQAVCAYPPAPALPPPLPAAAPPPPHLPVVPAPEPHSAPPAAPPPKGPAQVHGRVHVQSGSKAIPGAIIVLPGTNVRWVSDANGNFGGPLPEGVYDMLITARQYGEQRRSLDVNAGESVTMDVELRPLRRGHR